MSLLNCANVRMIPSSLPRIVTGREEMRSRKALTSAAPSGFANHCMLFFTKFCIAVQPIAQARSMADATPANSSQT